MPDRPSWPNCSSIGWISTAFSSVVVARSADIGVEDRHAIDGRPLRSLAIELVVEDGAHRTVGQGADLDCPRGGGFEAIGAERPHQPHDAEASAEALFGMGPALQDQLAERGGSWADRSGLAANALDRPVGVSPMARRHVLGHGGVPMITAGAQMSGNPLAPQEDLDGSRGPPHLHLTARKAVRHAVEMAFELDVVIDTNPADAPFGKAIGLPRQRVEVGPVELFEERPAGDAEPPDRAFVVELPQQLTDRRVELGQTVEATRPSSHRSMISTATSTFALSRGRRGLARRIAVS